MKLMNIRNRYINLEQVREAYFYSEDKIDLKFDSKHILVVWKKDGKFQPMKNDNYIEATKDEYRLLRNLLERELIYE